MQSTIPVFVIISNARMVDKCRCKRRELIDKGVCNKGFIWNPSNCECESDKSCDVGEYLNYQNWKCRKRLADKLVEERTDNTDEAKIAEIMLTENIHKCSSCALYNVIFNNLYNQHRSWYLFCLL